jgi:hypothetical protein
MLYFQAIVGHMLLKPQKAKLWKWGTDVYIFLKEHKFMRRNGEYK